MRRLSADAEQLAELLDLAVSPNDAPPPIAALLRVAAAAAGQHVPRARPEFVTDLREYLLTAAREPVPTSNLERAAAAVAERGARMRDSARLALASGIAACMVGSAGVAVASQEALPDQFLYSVKRATETVRLALADDAAAAGRLHLVFARTRLEEVQRGIDTLPRNLIEKTLEDMRRSSAAGADLLLEAFAESHAQALLDDLDAFITYQRDLLDRLVPTLPFAIQPQARQSLDLLRRIELQVALTIELCGNCVEDPRWLLGPAGDAVSGLNDPEPAPLGPPTAPASDTNPAPAREPEDPPTVPKPPADVPADGPDPDGEPDRIGDQVDSVIGDTLGELPAIDNDTEEIVTGSVDDLTDAVDDALGGTLPEGESIVVPDDVPNDPLPTEPPDLGW